MLLKWMLWNAVRRNAEDGSGAAGGGGGGAGGAAGAGAGDGVAGGGSGGGGASTPWFDSADLGLDEDVRVHLAGKNYPDLKTALRSGMEADTMARSRNVLPAFDPNKAADWPGWETLGWKRDPNEYKLEKPESPANVMLDEGLFETFRKAAHEALIPAGAAEKVFKDAFDYIAKQIEESDAHGAKSMADLEAGLQKDWGADYGRNKEIAKRAMSALGIGVDDAAELEQLMGSPRMVRMFHDIGAKLGEEHLVSPGAGGGALPASVSQIKAEQARLKADPEFTTSLRDARHPMHAENTARWNKIIKQLADAELAGR